MKRLLAVGAMLALWIGLGAAQAATFTVTNTKDSGQGSLREAIVSANASAGVPDTINFNVSGTITLGSVLPVITDTLTIDGSGRSITLSGGGAVQVLQLDSSTALTLKSLTIANGRSTSALSAGGVTVLAPSAPPAGGAALNVTGCVFSGNSTAGSFAAGAIMLNTGNASLTVTQSRFTGNSGQAANGSDPTAGAVFSTSSGAITVTNSTFENNSGSSGAIRQDTGSLTVSGSTFAGNSASNSGGAVSASQAGSIANSTFYGNSAALGGGALFFFGGFDVPGSLAVTHTTFSGNTSNAGNVASLNGAIFGVGTGKITLRNSVVANSTNGNCNGSVVDGGGNLSDDTSCLFTAATSLVNTLALLGPLQDNGGPTRTMAPLTGSPAIDQGVNQLAIDAGLTTDQRGAGFPRISPAGGTVDRGAFEVQVDKTPPTCTASAKPGVLSNPNHKLVDISTNVNAIDDKPGVTFTLRSVTSSEADSGLGRDDVPRDIQGWTVGSADVTGQLRSERYSKEGRAYTITYEARDAAGNTATCSATVKVPRN